MPTEFICKKCKCSSEDLPLCEATDMSGPTGLCVDCYELQRTLDYEYEYEYEIWFSEKRGKFRCKLSADHYEGYIMQSGETMAEALFKAITIDHFSEII